MNVENNELPGSWAWTTLGEMCSKPQYGWTTKANPNNGAVRLLRTTDISSGYIDWNTVPYCTDVPEDLAAYRLKQGDIVISRAGSVGVSYLLSYVPYETVFASYLIRFCPLEGIEPRYIAYYLQTPAYWLSIYEQSSGIALANVNARKLEAFNIPLAPLSEQHRIVAAIEEQFTRLDAGVAALRRAQIKLKKYRAAVLKAAVEGKLTGAWRAEHPETEPASILLERILKERRTRWEADLRAKGKDPAKVKYVEPAKPDTESLPELPEGWCWVIIEQLITYLRNGLPQKPESSPPGHRILRINAVRPMSVNLDEVRYLPLSEKEASGYFLDDGDILFTRYNGSLELLGVAGMVRSCFLPTLHPDKLIRVKTALAEPLSSYIEKASNVGVSRAYIESKARTTAGQTGISGSDIKQIPIPLPPLDEQEQIVAEVEQRLSVIAQLEAIVQANLKRAERLRQSILKEAFAGRLVPQDPNDEPASILLERIRKERDRRKKETASNGRYVHVPDEPVQKIHVEETQQAGLWESVGG